MNRLSIYGLSALLAAGCGQADLGNATPPSASSQATLSAMPAQASPSASNAPSARRGGETNSAALIDHDVVPPEPFSDGARAFATMRETLLKTYYDSGLTEDDLYRAAAAGMLEKMDPRMKAWQRLYSPREAAELKNDLRGEVVGVGVVIEFDEKSGYADVLDVLPKSPAEKAGIAGGDKVVSVQGKLYKGMKLADVVSDIRGKAGQRVTMTVLRGDKLRNFDLTRELVPFDEVGHGMLPERVGYLRVPGFNDRTTDEVKAALQSLALDGDHASSLVVDLRRCPGGSFDRALETADLLLAEGTPIVSVHTRGKSDDVRVSKGGGPLLDVPVVVLVGEATASAGEMLAGALREGRHARLVGERTTGKWSVQSLDELPNGYAFKYTIGLLFTPSGKTYQGQGLTPDVDVVMDATALSRANAASSMEARLPLDVQLRTAAALAKAAPHER